jgi:hypothetical protein
MSKSPYVEYLSKVLQGLSEAATAMQVGPDGKRRATMTIAVSDDGIEISIPWGKGFPASNTRPQGVSEFITIPIEIGPAPPPAPVRSPGDVILGKSRSGRTFRAHELVNALRNGWQGFELLCDKTKFDVHSDQLTRWLRKCMELGLIAKEGRAYVLTPAAMKVAA